MSESIKYLKSRWNGWNGNECVYKKEYHKAIEYYNTAIDLYPLEYRYFVNRSFCFDQLQQFESALEDAQRAVTLKPDWGKCYYRKARALKGLKRLEESELCFLKVIQLEGSDCKEVIHELQTLKDSKTIQSFSLNKTPDNKEMVEEFKRENTKQENKELIKNRKNGSDRTQSVSKCDDVRQSHNFSNIKNGNKTNADSKNKKVFTDSKGEKNLLKELSEFLLSKNEMLSKEKTQIMENKISEKKYNKSERKTNINEKRSLKTVENETKVSNELKTRTNRRNVHKGMDEIVEIWDDSRNQWSPNTNRTQNSVPSKSYRNSEPTNLWSFRGLYVSNVKTTDETKEILRHLLSEFGKVTQIQMIADKEMALINFDNPESPRVAMSRLQGAHLPNICIPNQNLLIRFRPLNDSKNYPSINCATERKLNKECYFWRTTGCSYSKLCKLKHIPANKGVDYQPWMQNLKNKFKRQNRRYDQL